LRVYLLGAPRLERDGVALKLDARKNVALVAYLAVAGLGQGGQGIGGAVFTREKLITLLWPELEPSRSRAGLRRNLSMLRKALGGNCLVVDRETVGLDPDAEVWLDVGRFNQLLSAWKGHGHPESETCAECVTALTEAAELYRGDFLTGFSLRDSPNFDEWQFFQTESLRQALASALERLVRGHSTQGTYELAIGYARRWLALDPLHEPAHQHLMQLYAWSGQWAAALRQYEQCQQVLDEELGVPPAEETTRLYKAIREKRDLPPPGESLIAPAQATILNNRYQLDAELGWDSMGVVYRARDILLDRDVAVKVFSAARLGTEGHARLLAEARAAAKLSHPNIVSVHDAGQADRGDGSGQVCSFIVTELVEGKSLHTRPPDTMEETVAIVRQVCAALAHAHAHGIIHRDVKPENVLLAPDGTVKLTDFSLARPMASRITSEGAIIGTVFYLAPELALGQEFDGRADLYALGVMLYELTTGQLPFTADNPMAVISQHLHAPVVPPRARKADIPPALDTLIVRLLSKDPAGRPASAVEALQILDSPDILDREIAPGEELSILKRIGHGRLVGREREMGEARALWLRAHAAEGQMLLLSGEAGIGKTRLVRELATQAQVTGGRALEGACYAEGGVPYAPFAQMLRQAIKGGYDGGLDLPEFVLADLLTLAPALQLSYPDIRPRPALDDPRANQQRLFESLVIFLAALSDRVPLLLVVEDIHWADSGTLYLLRHLGRYTRQNRVMIVATCRDVGPDEAQALHEMLLDLHRERLATHLRLPRLDREQSEALLAILFSEEITPEFLDGIYRETEGNPFFIEEVCKALVESGKLTYLDGRWDRPSMEALGIPHSVRVAIQSRVRVLPIEAQESLCLAAVLGREFDFDILAEATALAQADASLLPDQGTAPRRAWDDEALIDALEYAERAQLIEEVGAEAGGTFRFVHTLIPTTLVDSTRALKRRRLHRCAAAALEARRPADLEALAYHYKQAGQADKAADYLLQAGDRARRLYVHREAIAHYQEALEFLKAAGNLERAARTLMKLGLTYHNAFDFKAARHAYQEGFVFWQQMAETEPVDLPSRPPHALRVTALEPSSLSPGVAMDLPSAVFQDQLFSGLAEVSPDMSVVPDVARSWEVFDGGRKYVFHLRDDVQWSDGVPVTAGDFEYAWKRALNPARSWRAVELLYDIQGARAYHQGEVADSDQVGVRAIDDSTLVAELEGPTSYFPYLLAFSPMFPIPRHVVQTRGAAWEDPEHIVTNGPFRLAAWERGVSMVLERNATYHGRFTGNLQRVECSFLAGQTARLLQTYEANHLDICTDLPPTAWARARQRFAGEYFSGPRLSVDFIGFDVRRPPFDDRRVRRAFTLATDRETLADVALRGYASPATSGFVPPGMPGHSPGIGLRYDPGAARRLLAEAGYPGGRGFPPIECLARDDPGHDRLCEYLQAQWRESLGVEITWEQIAWGSFPGRMSSDMPHMWMVGYWADYPDPDDYLRVVWWLPPGWRNQIYERLVEDARRAMDQEERMTLYQQADRILVEEAPVLPLCYARIHMLVKPWVRRYRTSPLRWWYWKDVILEPH
jgi:ABC-type oligopeptide transport system substrate-binding subunit/DNA-binding SARP family transcriptional activator